MVYLDASGTAPMPRVYAVLGCRPRIVLGSIPKLRLHIGALEQGFCSLDKPVVAAKVRFPRHQSAPRGAYTRGA